jgi:hypothetical protein
MHTVDASCLISEKDVRDQLNAPYHGQSIISGEQVVIYIEARRYTKLHLGNASCGLQGRCKE